MRAGQSPEDICGAPGSLLQLPGVLGSGARGCQESPDNATCSRISHTSRQVAPHVSPSPASTTGCAKTTSAPTPAPAPRAMRAETALLVSPHQPPPAPTCSNPPQLHRDRLPGVSKRVSVETQFLFNSPLEITFCEQHSCLPNTPFHSFHGLESPPLPPKPTPTETIYNLDRYYWNLTDPKQG